jgi:hypothetical protein
MIPFGNHNATLFHKTSTGYSIHSIIGCSWFSTNERTLADGVSVITERTTCRYLSVYQRAEPGDLFVLGTVTEKIRNEIELVRYMQQLRSKGYRTFRVQSFADRSTGPVLPHYSAIGE